MSKTRSLENWRNLALGGYILEAGNSVEYETGTWRTRKPVWHADACTHCLTCWVFCPEDAFMLTDGLRKDGTKVKRIGEIDYYHCKGCGICVRECPVNRRQKHTALELVREDT